MGDAGSRRECRSSRLEGKPTLVAAVIQYSGNIFAIKILQDYGENMARILSGCQRNLKYCFATILRRAAILLEYCCILLLLGDYCSYNIAHILLKTAIIA
jgi:hypothetical protein